MPNQQEFGSVYYQFWMLYEEAIGSEYRYIEISFRITPLSNVGIDAPQISGKIYHDQASTLWLSHKNRPHPNYHHSLISFATISILMRKTHAIGQ